MRSRRASIAGAGWWPPASPQELRAEVHEARPRHARRFIDVEDLAALGAVGDELAEEPLDVLGDGSPRDSRSAASSLAIQTRTSS